MIPCILKFASRIGYDKKRIIRSPEDKIERHCESRIVFDSDDREARIIFDSGSLDDKLMREGGVSARRMADPMFPVTRSIASRAISIFTCQTQSSRPFPPLSSTRESDFSKRKNASPIIGTRRDYIISIHADTRISLDYASRSMDPFHARYIYIYIRVGWMGKSGGDTARQNFDDDGP